jgi:hypothetical protein
MVTRPDAAKPAKKPKSKAAKKAKIVRRKKK